MKFLYSGISAGASVDLMSPINIRHLRLVAPAAYSSAVQVTLPLFPQGARRHGLGLRAESGLLHHPDMLTGNPASFPFGLVRERLFLAGFFPLATAQAPFHPRAAP